MCGLDGSNEQYYCSNGEDEVMTWGRGGSKGKGREREGRKGKECQRYRK